MSDLSPFTVTPAAALLSRCVSRGALSQEDIDSASSQLSPAFSPHLHEVEQRIRAQRQLDQLQLDLELLQTERQSADVTHPFHLTVRFQELQSLCCHLQELLQQQSSLRQRLMRPVGHTHLPVKAHLHRCVVDSVKLLMDFVESLDQNLDSVRCGPASREQLQQLDASLAHLLSRVSEVEGLSNQILRWKEVSGVLSDSSASAH